ncbi:RNA-binding protein 48 [Bombyx mori]|uniref:RNA-binding protein 48 n=1 Tax=Bombyx mori TaxID=7091 RepID=A0A8R2GAU5_BOMMO|nr:RNA-binding protein 48 [Bombyx mori]
MSENEEKTSLLPHHVQQELCTTRLPYRQGRKLTAVKVYTVNNESTHLLVFGVPSINLRQETKSLVQRYGAIKKFNLTKEYECEIFTEAYHIQYEKIQSARIAKKYLDCKNYYGGVLHVCYAPEMETVNELKEKLIERRKDVFYRLHKNEKDLSFSKKTVVNEIDDVTQEKVAEKAKLNMGNFNLIHSNKRKTNNSNLVNKRLRNSHHLTDCKKINAKIDVLENNVTIQKSPKIELKHKDNVELQKRLKTDIDIVDCTSTERETITNINEALNYNKFGNEIIRNIVNKPPNKIIFSFNKNS